MTHRLKIIADNILGYTLCVILRLPAYILEKLLSRDHTLPPKEIPKTIVVAKYMGIGSILQATPMVRALKEKYPTAQIIFVSMKSNKTLLRRYDFIDKIVCVDDSNFYAVIKTSIAAIYQLLRSHVDIFFDLEVYSTYGSLMCMFSCAKNRVGFSLQETDYKSFMYTNMLFLNTKFPIRYCYYQLGRTAGINSPEEINPISPSLREDEIQAVRKRISELFAFEHQGIIALNPNASVLRYERRWSADSFTQIASHFAKAGYAVAMVGSKNERPYTQSIIDRLKEDAGRVINVAGEFSLIHFFAFLNQCKLVVTNDSGVMNMSLTLKVPQLLLAGPVDPEQYFIPNGYRSYIYYQTYCSPCTHYLEDPPCAGDNICMQLITVEDVIEFSEKLLSGHAVTPKRKGRLFFQSDIVMGVLKDRGAKRETVQ